MEILSDGLPVAALTKLESFRRCIISLLFSRTLFIKTSLLYDFAFLRVFLKARMFTDRKIIRIRKGAHRSEIFQTDIYLR